MPYKGLKRTTFNALRSAYGRDGLRDVLTPVPQATDELFGFQPQPNLDRPPQGVDEGSIADVEGLGEGTTVDVAATVGAGMPTQAGQLA